MRIELFFEMKASLYLNSQGKIWGEEISPCPIEFSILILQEASEYCWSFWGTTISRSYPRLPIRSFIHSTCRCSFSFRGISLTHLLSSGNLSKDDSIPFWNPISLQSSWSISFPFHSRRWASRQPCFGSPSLYTGADITWTGCSYGFCRIYLLWACMLMPFFLFWAK